MRTVRDLGMATEELDIAGAGGKMGRESPDDGRRRRARAHITPHQRELLAALEAHERTLAQRRPSAELALAAVDAYSDRLWRAREAEDARAVETWRALGLQAARVADAYAEEKRVVDYIGRIWRGLGGGLA